MKISNIKVFPSKIQGGTIKANGSFTLDGMVEIKYTVLKGSKGLFVGLPGRYGEKINPETGKKIFYTDVKVVDDEFKKELDNALLKAYSDHLNGKPTNQGSSPGPTSQISDDDIPF